MEARPQPGWAWAYRTPEVHGYDPEASYRVYTSKTLEIAHHEP